MRVQIYKYFLILLGFFMISWYIWNRFIHERLPKNIQINLTEFGLYIIIYICCIYFYIVINLIKPRKPHPFVTKIIDIIYKPLMSLDETIKSMKNIHIIHGKMINFILPILTTLSIKKIKIIYIIMYIIPRTILIITLFIDIFYFQKLYYIYKILLLGIIPLVHRYIKYSLKYPKNYYVKYLEDIYIFVDIYQKDYRNENWDSDNAWNWKPHINAIHHNTLVKIKEYISIQLEIRYSTSEIEYRGEPLKKKDYIERYAEEKYGDKEALLNKKDYDNLGKEFHITILKIYNLSDFIECYNYVDKEGVLKWIKIFIFSGYFICWFYILCKSFHTVEEFPLFINIITLLNNVVIEIKYESPF